MKPIPIDVRSTSGPPVANFTHQPNAIPNSSSNTMNTPLNLSHDWNFKTSPIPPKRLEMVSRGEFLKIVHCSLAPTYLVDFMQPNLTGGASENSVGTISSSVSGYSSRDVPPTSFIHIDPLNDDMIRFDPSWTSCSTGLVTVQYRWSCHYQYFGFLAPFPILSVSRSSINTQKSERRCMSFESDGRIQ